MPVGRQTGGPKATDTEHAGTLVFGENYEELRGAVLAGDTGRWQPGHGVLVTRGMAAWMAAWAPAMGTAPTETTTPVLSLDPVPTPRPPQAPSSRLGANPIVTVLAQMALAHA